MLYTQMPFCFRFSGGVFFAVCFFLEGRCGREEDGEGGRELLRWRHTLGSLSVCWKKGAQTKIPTVLQESMDASRSGEARRLLGSLAGMQRQRKPEPAMINAAPHPRSETSRMRKSEDPPPFSIVWVSGGGESLRRSRARKSKKS